MLWLLLPAGGAGVLLGLWLRVPALLAASVALVGTAAVLMTLGEWPLGEAIAFIFMLLTALQVGYLVGLLLPSAWTRVASRHLSRVSTRRR